MSLVPVGSEQPETTCAGCAALVADQRYCLACGQPTSPVRLAFLDVLQADPATARNGVAGSWQRHDASLAPWDPAAHEGGPGAWVRRNTGLLSLGAVLLLCLVVGLLVGHWTQGTDHGPQVVKIEGLSGLGVAGGAAQPAASSTPSASGGAPATGAKEKKEEAQAAKEAAKETKAEKAPPPAPVKVTQTKLKKLTQSTGKKHQEELNALGAQPIETG